MVYVGHREDQVQPGFGVDGDSRQCGVEAAVGEHGCRSPVRRNRFDGSTDPGERDRIPYDPTGRLVIGMSHAAHPGVAPGQNAIGTNISEDPRDPRGGLVSGLYGRVWKIEKHRLDAEKNSNAGRHRVPAGCDFLDGKTAVCIGRFTASQPHEHDPVAPGHLAGNRGDHSNFVVRMGQGDEQRPGRNDARRLRQDEAAALADVLYRKDVRT